MSFYNGSAVAWRFRIPRSRLEGFVSTVLPKRVPIPSLFHADDTKAPFQTCLVCDRPLLDGSTEYVIEKGYRSFDGYDVEETVFGYAICMGCHATLSESFSTLSKKRCQAYLGERIDLEDRTTTLFDGDALSPEAWTDHCIVHDTAKENLGEYQILAHCHGNDLLLSHLPLMIGGPAVDELVQRLSNETLDELGGFRDEYFGLPPELQKNLQGPVLV